MLNTHDEKRNQTRRGFKNAELGEAPGGAKSERATTGAVACGTAISAVVAACRSTRKRVGTGVVTTSADTVSQPGVAIACIIDVAGVEATESEAP